MTLTLLDAVASTSASAVRPTLSDRKLFTLVYVGEATPRPASDDEAAALGRALACELALPVPAARSAAGQPASTHAESSPTQQTPRPAGPCLHCGATGMRPPPALTKRTHFEICSFWGCPSAVCPCPSLQPYRHECALLKQ